LPAAGKTVRLRVFVDRSSVELFAGDGQTTISDRIFPSAGSDGIAFFSKGSGARVISLELWPLASIWK
jgi:sucrose-6-phosphate hydrolase SacC (GH32 family)